MALEVFGDRWTLLIVRDLLFKQRRTYQDFLGAEEGIATNVLADRLALLESEGLVTRSTDRDDGGAAVSYFTRSIAFIVGWNVQM